MSLDIAAPAHEALSNSVREPVSARICRRVAALRAAEKFFRVSIERTTSCANGPFWSSRSQMDSEFDWE